MKKMKIFEPAMCCPTGLCGVGVDPELLRISTVLDTLKKQGIVVDRLNLNSAPAEFITDQTINAFLKLISSFDFGQKEKAHRGDEPSHDAVQFWFMSSRYRSGSCRRPHPPTIR